MQGSQQTYVQGELPPNQQQFVTRTVEYRNGNISNSQSSPTRVPAPISFPPPPQPPQYYAPLQQQHQSYNTTYVNSNPDQNRTATSNTYIYTSTTTNQNNLNDLQAQRLNDGQPRSNM